MVRKSLIEKNNKIKSKCDKHYLTRKELKNIVRNLSVAPKERFKTQLILDARNKNESLTRFVKRCQVTGKKTGFLGFFGVSRHVFRELAFKGYIPGLTKGF